MVEGVGVLAFLGQGQAALDALTDTVEDLKVTGKGIKVFSTLG